MKTPSGAKIKGAIKVDLLQEKMEEIIQAVDALVKKEVDAYNKANFTAFASIHNCASYINNPTYTHYEFCKAVWDWSVSVWETAREIQTQFMQGEIEEPSVDEFVEMLPKFGGSE